MKARRCPTTVFDVETTSLPEDAIEKVKPTFKAPRHYKDPAKIESAIAEAEAAWREKAALDAKTAQVLAIGLLCDNEPCILLGREASMLEGFWQAWAEDGRMVGFNCKHFDLPMLWQRSVILGVKTPSDLLCGRYFNSRVVDLQEVWTLYGRNTEGQSLDSICRAMGLPGKTGNGADFGKLFETDLKAARAYLEADLIATMALATRLGIT